jgi:hypothetical protein
VYHIIHPTPDKQAACDAMQILGIGAGRQLYFKHMKRVLKLQPTSRAVASKTIYLGRREI